MSFTRSEFALSELQWLKIHLRLAAREQSSSRLSYRFEFLQQPSVDITCDVYYIDDDSNSMKLVPESERMEIYQGRIGLGMNIVHRALELAELPSSFTWKPTLRFVLHEECGMGGAVVYTETRSFTWPEMPES